ncbi:EAL domain, c-di-GMP-specific phosphodiesterase class I (or its enzymatically inactive variant) [Micromonospora coriariae]|uniref:EAL domain, c-di-GMP-specific phosphodiesterase class I (Or its enzymatically inactive variant) n=1 Tax=Micromonospora coriariae TaxID=285665 RepID=A0A1C4UYZ8_9ACTN|nr:EAL domain, c-di-GMP-specific phosphodiesterase class I (or its enzymatically inactive variant) [Micromonospora coriariae]
MSAAVALLVLAGAADLVPTSVVSALAGGAGATLAGVRLSRLATRRPAELSPTDVPPVDPSTAEQWRRAARRSAGVLLDAAVVAAGLTAAVLPLVDTGHRTATLTGLLVTAVLSTAGLRRLPGRARPPARVRLRHLIEATGPAVGLALAAWLLLPHDILPVPGRLVAALGLGGLGMAALNAFTGPQRRSGAAICRGGVLLTLTGLALVATLPPPAPAGRAALLAVPPLVLGMLLTALGAGDAMDAGGVEPAEGEHTTAWPRSVLPAALLLLASGLQLGAGRSPDRMSVLLAVAAVPPLVLRELLRSGDAATPDRRAAHRRRAGRAVRHRRAMQPGWLGSPEGHTGTPDDGPTSSNGVGSTWPPDGEVSWSALGPRSVSAGDGPGDRAALLDALASIGDVPAPAGALLLVDLHGADGIGPAARENMLAEAVRRARAVVAPGDLVTGCTGAGFAVVTAAGPVLAYALGTRLLTALAPPYRLAGAVLRVQASIGLAEVSGAGPADVLRQAELARRRAVQLGRDRVEWYDAFLEEQLVRRLDLERELPGAVARGELDLVYQPVLDLASRQPVGAEALLRWRSPVLGTVLPAELLPVAEDLDLVGELEWWVLDRACRQLADWSAGTRELWMAVNVTTRELTTPDFVQRAAAVLAAYGVSPERLVVEVAEPRVAADLTTVVARLAGLRSLGVRTALDDFRAEHASLAQLRRLPIDLLKVGPELVGARPDGQPPLIDVVVNVGERLGVEIVAEELESPNQVEGAHRAGCRYGQGFALARPATAERVEAYFEEFPSASR